MGVYYRRAELSLLRRSISSILCQTFADFELLICDDGSSEDARAYLSEVAAADSRLCLIRPGGKFSLPEKLNACLAAANGLYIARMDDDDFSHPDRFEKQLAFLEAHPAIAFVGCSVSLCRDGAPFGSRELPEYPQVRDFYMTQPFVHPALLFRREPLEEIGGYSEDDRQLLCEDYDLLLRLYAKGYRGANLPEPLLDYTAPDIRGGRRMCHRWNEAVTRYQRFRALGVLPGALPYVVKPIIVGLLPGFVLKRIKRHGY